MKWIWIGLIVVLVSAVAFSLVQKPQIVSNLASGIDMNTRAPGFEGGGEWLNSEPLEMKKLMAENKLVLVDFWTYSCVNCQRTIPYLKQWWEKYKDKGLVIVGVHSPEFEFEKDIDNVRGALKRYNVTWPVVQDNEMKIWSAYANRYWPAKYMVAPPEGKIVYSHFGEGDYEQTENEIKSQLMKLGYDVSGTQVGSDKGESGRVAGLSPETYVGYERGAYGNREQIEPEKTKIYEIKGNISRDRVYLGGEWSVMGEYAKAGKGGVMEYKFKAGEVNLVMRGKGEVKVSIDGGVVKTIEVTADDLYNLYKGAVKEGVLKLEFEQGLEAYAFTFGG